MKINQTIDIFDTSFSGQTENEIKPSAEEVKNIVPSIADDIVAPIDVSSAKPEEVSTYNNEETVSTSVKPEKSRDDDIVSASHELKEADESDEEDYNEGYESYDNECIMDEVNPMESDEPLFDEDIVSPEYIVEDNPPATSETSGLTVTPEEPEIKQEEIQAMEKTAPEKRSSEMEEEKRTVSSVSKQGAKPQCASNPQQTSNSPRESSKTNESNNSESVTKGNNGFEKKFTKSDKFRPNKKKNGNPAAKQEAHESAKNDNDTQAAVKDTITDKEKALHTAHESSDSKPVKTEPVKSAEEQPISKKEPIPEIKPFYEEPVSAVDAKPEITHYVPNTNEAPQEESDRTEEPVKEESDRGEKKTDIPKGGMPTGDSLAREIDNSKESKHKKWVEDEDDEEEDDEEGILDFLKMIWKRITETPDLDIEERKQSTSDLNEDGYYDDVKSLAPPEDARVQAKAVLRVIFWILFVFLFIVVIIYTM